MSGIAQTGWCPRCGPVKGCGWMETPPIAAEAPYPGMPVWVHTSTRQGWLPRKLFGLFIAPIDDGRDRIQVFWPGTESDGGGTRELQARRLEGEPGYDHGHLWEPASRS